MTETGQQLETQLSSEAIAAEIHVLTQEYKRTLRYAPALNEAIVDAWWERSKAQRKRPINFQLGEDEYYLEYSPHGEEGNYIALRRRTINPAELAVYREGEHSEWYADDYEWEAQVQLQDRQGQTDKPSEVYYISPTVFQQYPGSDRHLMVRNTPAALKGANEFLDRLKIGSKSSRLTSFTQAPSIIDATAHAKGT